jgi:hypothetical protein
MSNKNLLEISNRIYLIRDQKVMLDRDLAELYGVEVKRLNEQVKRNWDRFPEEFCFKPNSSKLVDLRSQFATCEVLTPQNHKLPLVFEEQ